jgi:hypothetical protein
MTADLSLHTNNTVKRSPGQPPIHSRNDGTILKPKKLQRFSAEKRKKMLSVDEKRFKTVQLKLRTMYLFILHSLSPF